MRLPSFRSHATSSPAGAMTPLIDVVFQLLVYFLCTASFNPPEYQLPANLPSTGIGQPQEIPPEIAELEVLRIRLTVSDGQTRVWLNDGALDGFDELHRRLQRLAQLAPLPVIIDADDEIPMGDLVRAYDLCLQAGLTDVRFAAPAP